MQQLYLGIFPFCCTNSLLQFGLVKPEIPIAMELPLTSALLLLLPLLCFLWLRRDTRRQSRSDGLKAYPIIGTLPHFVKNQDCLVEWSAGVVARCPTHTMAFDFKGLGLMAGAITANPANVEYIVKTNFQNYPKGEFVVSAMADFLGHGIFNSDGDQWLSQRKAASYEFSKRSLRNFVVSTVRFEVVERLLPLLSRAELEGLTLDMQDVLERFAFDNICCVAFDEDPACLTDNGLGVNGRAEFMHALNDAQIMIMARFMSPVKWAWRVKKLLNMGPERRMSEALATIHGYVDRIIRDRSERGAAGLARKDDFLSRFVSSGEHSNESLRDVVTSFIIAGRDTTSSALTWFFWLVSSRHEVEAKIVREIRAVRASYGSADAAFSLDELREMHYLHAAVTESMRLYPPVAMDSRCCKHDDVLPDGTFVGKGWQVSYSAYAMARLEEIWGNDCAEYRPERWLDEEGAFRPESSFKYPVFHAGPRMCLGKEMAYIQMKSIAACVLERFSFQFVGGESRPGLVFSVTLRMEGGLPMQVKKRGH
uniref:Cytochrome P450 94A1 n=1 Tax=Aegilops tauschii subsp. strangulata TaxID=200361 RepID=A0A453FQY4_AEGTS